MQTPIPLGLSISGHVFQYFLKRLINVWPNKFGVRKNSSTCFEIIRIFDLVTRWLEYESVSVVFIVGFDLKKAFDTVSHSIKFSKFTN